MNINRFGTCFLLLTIIDLSAAIAAPSQDEVVVTNAVTMSQNDIVVGPMGLTQPMHVVIALQLRNQAQLHALISTPAGTPLTPAQFAAQFSPTQAQAQQVANFLTRAGFQNVTIAPNRLLVSGDAIVASVQAAFKTSMVRVHTHDGREAYANSADVRIPVALQSSVQAVLGLQNVDIMHTFSNPAQSSVVPESLCNPGTNVSQDSDGVSPPDHFMQGRSQSYRLSVNL